jgi:hypothetical protein
MPGIARQFEPRITRSGGAPSKYRFNIRCSAYLKTDIYEAAKPTGDDLVKGYVKERGWLLGRDRAYDLCSACLTNPRGNQPLRPVHEVGRHRSSEVTKRSDRSQAPGDGRCRDTADILARHLGRPEARTEEFSALSPR